MRRDEWMGGNRMRETKQGRKKDIREKENDNEVLQNI